MGGTRVSAPDWIMTKQCIRSIRLDTCKTQGIRQMAWLLTKIFLDWGNVNLWYPNTEVQYHNVRNLWGVQYRDKQVVLHSKLALNIHKLCCKSIDSVYHCSITWAQLVLLVSQREHLIVFANLFFPPHPEFCLEPRRFAGTPFCTWWKGALSGLKFLCWSKETMM